MPGIKIKIDASDAVREGKKAEGALNNVSKSAKTAEKDVGKFSKALGIDKEVRAMRAGLGKIAVAMGSFYAVKKIEDYLISVTRAAGKYDMLGLAMYTAGKNAGYSEKMMDEYEAALKRSGIAAIEARQSITRLAASGVDLAKSAQLARAAQDLAVVGGINSSEAFERMSSAIQKGQVIMLHTLGINATFEQGYEKMAKSLGKNTAQLTENEKIQSRVNIVLEATSKYQGIYEKSMTSAEKQYLSLTRHIQTYEIAFGKAFQPAYLQYVKAQTDLYKDLTEAVSDPEFQRSLEATSKNFMAIYSAAVKLIATKLPDYLSDLSTNMEAMASVWRDMPDWMQKAVEITLLAGAAWFTTAGKVAAAGYVIGEGTGILADNIKALDAYQQGLISGWDYAKFLAGATITIDTLSEEGKAYRQAKKDYEDLFNAKQKASVPGSQYKAPDESEIIAAYKKMQEALEQYMGAQDKYQGKISGYIAEISGLATVLDGLASSQESASSVFGDVGIKNQFYDGLTEGQIELSIFRKASEDAAKAEQDREDAHKKARDEQDAAAKSAKDHAEAIKKIIDNLNWELSIVKETENEQAALNAVRAAGASATKAQKEEIYKKTKALQAERDMIAFNREELARLAQDYAANDYEGVEANFQWDENIKQQVQKWNDYLKTEVDELEQKYQELDALFKQGEITPEVYYNALGKLTDEHNDAAEKIVSTWEHTKEKIQDITADFFAGAMKGEVDSFSALAQSFGNAMIDITSQSMAESFKDFKFDGLSDVLGETLGGVFKSLTDDVGFEIQNLVAVAATLYNTTKMTKIQGGISGGVAGAQAGGSTGNWYAAIAGGVLGAAAGTLLGDNGPSYGEQLSDAIKELIKTLQANNILLADQILKTDELTLAQENMTRSIFSTKMEGVNATLAGAFKIPEGMEKRSHSSSIYKGVLADFAGTFMDELAGLGTAGSLNPTLRDEGYTATKYSKAETSDIISDLIGIIGVPDFIMLMKETSDDSGAIIRKLVETGQITSEIPERVLKYFSDGSSDAKRNEKVAGAIFEVMLNGIMELSVGVDKMNQASVAFAKTWADKDLTAYKKDMQDWQDTMNVFAGEDMQRYLAEIQAAKDALMMTSQEDIDKMDASQLADHIKQINALDLVYTETLTKEAEAKKTLGIIEKYYADQVAQTLEDMDREMTIALGNMSKMEQQYQSIDESAEKYRKELIDSNMTVDEAATKTATYADTMKGIILQNQIKADTESYTMRILQAQGDEAAILNYQRKQEIEAINDTYGASTAEAASMLELAKETWLAEDATSAATDALDEHTKALQREIEAAQHSIDTFSFANIQKQIADIQFSGVQERKDIYENTANYTAAGMIPEAATRIEQSYIQQGQAIEEVIAELNDYINGLNSEMARLTDTGSEYEKQLASIEQWRQDEISSIKEMVGGWPVADTLIDAVNDSADAQIRLAQAAQEDSLAADRMTFFDDIQSFVDGFKDIPVTFESELDGITKAFDDYEASANALGLATEDLIKLHDLEAEAIDALNVKYNNLIATQANDLFQSMGEDIFSGLADAMTQEQWRFEQQINEINKLNESGRLDADHYAGLIEMANQLHEIKMREADEEINTATELLGLYEDIAGRVKSLSDSITSDLKAFTDKDSLMAAFTANKEAIAGLDPLSESYYEDSINLLEEQYDIGKDLYTLEDDAWKESLEIQREALETQKETLEKQIDSISALNDLLWELQGGSMSPVQSLEGFQNQYAKLYSEAMASGDPTDFISFVQGDFADFLKGFGNYQDIQPQIVSDVNTMIDSIGGGASLTDLELQLKMVNEQLDAIDTKLSAETTEIVIDGKTMQEWLAGLGGQVGGFGGNLDVAIGNLGLEINAQNEAALAFVQGINDLLIPMQTIADSDSPLIDSNNALIESLNALNTSLTYAFIEKMNPADVLNTEYRNLFDRLPDVAGMEYWMGQINSGAFAIADLQAQLLGAASPEDLEIAQTKGYASGGYHSGGMRLVGERGPEMEFTGPSRISSNSDSVDMIASAVSKAIGGNGGGNITVKVYVGNKELKDITTEVLRTHGEAQKQVKRIMKAA